jgi:hypothetical protein
MKKFLFLYLIVAFIGISCASYKRGEGIDLESGQKPGARVIIQKTDGQHIEGELIAVKDDSLLLKEQESGADVTVGISDISVIKIVKGAKSSKGALAGGLIGAGIGIAILHVSDAELASDPEGGIGANLMVGLLGAIPGALLGALAGPALISDKKYQIEGVTERQIQWALNELRKEARIPNFQ